MESKPIINVQIDYEKLAKSLVKAQLEMQKKQLEEEQRGREKSRDEWNEALGFKKYSSEKRYVPRLINEIKSYISFTKHLILFEEKHAKRDYGTIAVLKLSLKLVLGVIQVCLYFLFASFGVVSVYSISEGVLEFNPFYMLLAFLAFLFARIIRIVQFEIYHIEDREYLIGMLSAVTSFVAMILALVSILI